MYHSFLIHSSADEHLGCFHVIINSAAMNTPPPAHTCSAIQSLQEDAHRSKLLSLRV